MKIPKKYWMMVWVSLPTILIDQVTKWIVDQNFRLGESMAVLPGFFSLTYVRNPGAAFGMFGTAHPVFRYLFLTFVPLIALGAIIHFYRSVPPGHKLMPFALSLVLGGAIGNLICRVRFRYVIDFFDVYIGAHHWPAFNIADSAICVGIGLMLYHMMFIEGKTAPGKVA